MTNTFKGIEIERIIYDDGTFDDVIPVSNLEGKMIVDQVAKQKQTKYFRDKKSYDNFSDIVGGFSFMLVDTLKAFHQDDRFTDIEKARIMFLGTYCSYEEAGRYLFTNNNRHILKSDLPELLEMTNKKEFYKFYNKLVETGIIHEEAKNRNEVRLKWNNKYHFKGATKSNGTKSTDTVRTYDSQIQALYKEKNERGKSINTPKNLYILFMVLPFINSESGVLCHQQHNPIEADCQPLELDDLREMFGYERVTTLKTKLLGCKLYSTNVFFIGEGTLDRKKYTRIFVSPYVASRSGNKAPNESLLAMFPNTQKAIVQKHMEKRKKK
jgi:hypothetical protein